MHVLHRDALAAAVDAQSEALRVHVNESGSAARHRTQTRDVVPRQHHRVGVTQQRPDIGCLRRGDSSSSGSQKRQTVSGPKPVPRQVQHQIRRVQAGQAGEWDRAHEARPLARPE